MNQGIMKRILLICSRENIDPPLRRSLSHLAGSCQIEVVSDSFQAYDVLMDKAFDLIIVDFEIRGIDSLELIESIEYIDPGIPIILLLQQQHKAVRGLAHHLNANPILQPFKPLTFLRLVDTTP
jgi:DNA-binding NtrC family response regulator